MITITQTGKFLSVPPNSFPAQYSSNVQCELIRDPDYVDMIVSVKIEYLTTDSIYSTYTTATVPITNDVFELPAQFFASEKQKSYFTISYTDPTTGQVFDLDKYAVVIKDGIAPGITIDPIDSLENLVLNIVSQMAHNQISFDQTPDTAGIIAGDLFHNETYKMLSYRTPYGDVELPMDDVTIVVNKTGATIPAFTPVLISGSTGEIAQITPVSTANIASGVPIGIVPYGGIANNATGMVQTRGYINNITTSQWQLNDLLYIDPVTSTLTTTPPNPGEPVVIMGQVIKLAGGNGGRIFTFVVFEPAATQVGYDNSTSGLSAENTQDAIDELANEKVDKVTGKQLSTEDYTTAEKSKLAGIEPGAQVNTVTSVAGRTGAVTLAKADVGLSNADNTSDLDKPISNAQALVNASDDARLDSLENLDTEIYGAYWNGSSSPTMTRTHGAIGATVNAGVGTTQVLNTADFWSVFKDNVEVTDSYGNQFVKWKKTYIRKIFLLPGYFWKGVSRFKHDDNWYIPACFYDFDNNLELDHVYIGKYPASLSDDGLRLESKTGKFPLSSKNIVEFRNLAKANGAGYQQLDIHVVDLLTTLYEIEQATLNSQIACAGFTSGQWNASQTAVIAETGVNRIVVANAYADGYRVGQTIGIGTSLGGNQIATNRLITAIAVYDASNKAITFDGATVNVAIGNIVYNLPMKNGTCDAIVASVGSPVSNSDGKQTFKWHGIESLFGNIWQCVDGVNINEFQAWVCRNADNYVSNLFGAPYEQLGYVNANANGNPIEMGYDSNLPFANFPKTLGGSSTTYYSDYYYQAAGQRIARIGGYVYDSYDAGLRFWNLNILSSGSGANLGGRLIRKAVS